MFQVFNPKKKIESTERPLGYVHAGMFGGSDATKFWNNLNGLINEDIQREENTYIDFN